MPIFRRNINGWDVLALWQYIHRRQPVERSEIIRRYYPGDPDEPNESAKRKNLNDAIDFLVEIDQIINNEEGYKINEDYSEEPSPRVAMLRGIRTQNGENGGYNDILDVLTEDNLRYFDHRDQLEDLMSGRRSEVTWNETRLGYWVRTMETIGAVKRLNTSSDENHTAILSLKRELLLQLLRAVIESSNPQQLRKVLDELDDQYLPMYAGAGRGKVAQYVQNTLSLADRRNDISLRRESDFGQAVEINQSGYNSISLASEVIE